MTSNTRKLIFILMVVMIAIIAILHSVTPGHKLLFHDTYRRLSYFPIVIGAVLYGTRGGVFMALISCLGFIPHLYTFWAAGPEAYYSEFSEIFFYMAAGLIIGLISDSENRMKKKYKALSQKLGRSYERLTEQASQLLEAEKQLGESRKLSILGHVSASFAHEIKNPLASIKGAAEILADEVKEDHPKYEFVGIMRSEISRLDASVEKVLDYCRSRRGRLDHEYGSAKSVMDHVLSLIAPDLKKNGIKVSVDYKDQSADFEIQKDPMIQVLLNVLINAKDAVDRNGKIQIESKTHDNGLLIGISDNGSGIDEAMEKEIFHSFVTTKKNGTGLGLPISKRIIESLGGGISIEKSNIGGAQVTVYLPSKNKMPGQEG